MKWKKKAAPAVGAVACQLRRKEHPFSNLRGYVPLGGGEEQIYHEIREAIPVLDAELCIRDRYKACIQAAMQLGFQPFMLKFVTAMLFLLVLVLSGRKGETIIRA